MNKENIKKLISLIIEGSGDNHARDGLKGTPERVANLYEELFSGYKKDINDIVNNSLFDTTLDDMIVVKNIDDAVTEAYKVANVLLKKNKDKISILLSPACSSYDMYDSYEERGRHFKSKVIKEYR